MPHLLIWQGGNVGRDKNIKKLTTSNISFYCDSESKISGDNKCKNASCTIFQILFWYS
jgi:hypothetical protein